MQSLDENTLQYIDKRFNYHLEYTHSVPLTRPTKVRTIEEFRTILRTFYLNRAFNDFNCMCNAIADILTDLFTLWLKTSEPYDEYTANATIDGIVTDFMNYFITTIKDIDEPVCNKIYEIDEYVETSIRNGVKWIRM